MLKINKKLTPYNYASMSNKKIEWIVIHYVGAESSAKNNAQYFYSGKRGASANYFVDENEIWQVVEDYNCAWHIGAMKYYNGARNTNSIGIEMCCKKHKNGEWYFEERTIKNTVELTAYLIKKYDLDIFRITRHFDCTKKCCPAPFVKNEKDWIRFKELVMEELRKMNEEEKVMTMQEKCKVIQDYYGLDNNTTLYFQFYRYNVALIDKLYNKAKNGLTSGKNEG